MWIDLKIVVVEYILEKYKKLLRILHNSIYEFI